MEGAERASVTQPEEYARAILNLLEDFAADRERLVQTQRAALNILEDFSEERSRLETTQRAVLNILDDFAAEKERLEATQRAVLNILEDFEAQKSAVEAANRALRTEIVERQSAEQALLRSNTELEQFAYVASHDLQEPLRMVSSYVQLFARRYQAQVDPQGEKYIQYAVDGARRMQALINALLEYSRVGRRDQPGRVEARQALDEALLNLASSIEESEAQVSAGPLPAVVMDPKALVRVFQNLIANALKFRRPGEPPRVAVSAEPEGRLVRFAVRDCGIGLDPRYAERIFVIFQRLHTRSEYPGTGIGLSICKKVVERHGGRIWVESQPGEGATFFFTAPRALEVNG